MSDYLIPFDGKRRLTPDQLLAELRSRGFDLAWRAYYIGTEDTHGYLVAPGDPEGGGAVLVSTAAFLELEREELDDAYGAELEAADRERLRRADAAYRVTASAGAGLDPRRIATVTAAVLAGSGDAVVLDADDRIYGADEFRRLAEAGPP